VLDIELYGLDPHSLSRGVAGLGDPAEDPNSTRLALPSIPKTSLLEVARFVHQVLATDNNPNSIMHYQNKLSSELER